MEEIVQRTASAMVARGIPFSGVLFAGLMIRDGKVPWLFPNNKPPGSQTVWRKGQIFAPEAMREPN